MPSVDELTRLADRLRTRRPNQAERNAIAGLLDRWANDLAPPEPEPTKPATLQEAIEAFGDEPPEQQDEPAPKPKRKYTRRKPKAESEGGK